MSRQVGKGFVGSNRLMFSKVDEEVIVADKKQLPLYELNFNNLDDCTITVNNESAIFLYASQGFKTTSTDARVNSVKIKESNVRYFWNGKY